MVILGSLVSGAFIMLARAASSKDILSDLNTLKQQQSEIQAQSSKLEASIADNQAKTQTLVDKKADIDQQMDLTRQQIDNLNGQIQQYSLLIAQKQDDLDQSMAQEEAMSEQYKTRLRSMEESGTISYWSILFKASSFSDLLDRVDMIKEIAASDQVMLQKLSDMSKSIEQERTELESQKTDLESAKTDLNTQQATMETQRAESDKLILQMADEYASIVGRVSPAVMIAAPLPRCSLSSVRPPKLLRKLLTAIALQPRRRPSTRSSLRSPVKG